MFPYSQSKILHGFKKVAAAGLVGAVAIFPTSAFADDNANKNNPRFIEQKDGTVSVVDGFSAPNSDGTTADYEMECNFKRGAAGKKIWTGKGFLNIVTRAANGDKIADESYTNLDGVGTFRAFVPEANNFVTMREGEAQCPTTQNTIAKMKDDMGGFCTVMEKALNKYSGKPVAGPAESILISQPMDNKAVANASYDLLMQKLTIFDSHTYEGPKGSQVDTDIAFADGHNGTLTQTSDGAYTMMAFTGSGAGFVGVSVGADQKITIFHQSDIIDGKNVQTTVHTFDPKADRIFVDRYKINPQTGESSTLPKATALFNPDQFRALGDYAKDMAAATNMVSPKTPFKPQGPKQGRNTFGPKT